MGNRTSPELGQAFQGHSDLEPAADFFSQQLEKSEAVSVLAVSLGSSGHKGHAGPEASGHQPSQLCSESLGRIGKHWLARKQRCYPAVSNQLLRPGPRVGGWGGAQDSLKLVTSHRGWEGMLPTQEPSQTSPQQSGK